MIHEHFNSSLFLSVNPHTSFLYFFIVTCQHLLSIIILSPNHSFYLILPPNTLLVLPPPPLSLSHPLPCTFKNCPFHLICSHMCSTLLSPSHPIPFHLAYPSLYWCFFSFSLLVLLAPTTTSFLLILALTNLTLSSTTWWSENPRPILLTTQIINSRKLFKKKALTQ